ncbi:arabinosyltransferase domain-containing protein [Corynebacterium glutamicum]|uniref:arabinosyltransferase domain-containing protein n=1 Tax=Corynebacterium glutamicum TaxID=1718 RepID=UPI000943DB6C|nr:arabinosyltransferase domain-containing protein [Corynebacterium glutamicum]OKX79969.1 arabinosyltransferase [Corynebacterium glutamicum]
MRQVGGNGGHQLDSINVSDVVESKKLKGSAQEPPQVAPGWLKKLAISSGLLGLLMFVLLPFLPVNQVQSSLSWPQNGELSSVNAPLISYAPQSMDASIPVSALDSLNDNQTLVMGTLPLDSTDATNRGLFVRTIDGNLDVIVRGEVLLDLSPTEVNRLPDDAILEISSTEETTSAEITGTAFSGETEGDERPQVTGVYTELADDPSTASALASAGLKVDIEINSRFTSSPSLLKYAAIFIGLASVLVSLWALHRMDILDGRKAHRFLPANWYKLKPLDGVVVAILVFWHFIGANTSDDGFIMNMARVSQNADYMANYYRWFGVPESPFGAPYYDLLALMAYVSTSSIWLRLPALLAGLIMWFVITREVMPRFGSLVGRRVAHWSAAMVFLAFWLPYNNGTRPEPIIAMGALLAWVSFERAIATSRLLPAAIGVIIATISLASGPTGLMAVAALLVSLSSLIRILYRRLPLIGAPRGASKSKVFGASMAMLAPFLASGTAILIAVFGDQTLSTVMESISVRSAKGPSLTWYHEYVRYQTVMEQTVDGSFTRRFAVLILMACLAIVVIAILRYGRIPGAAKGPSLRLMMVIFGTMFFMMFTPTKWTHHFGVYAGLAGALAGLAAVGLSYVAVKSPRMRTISIGAFLFLLALALAGVNGFWYTSSYSVPWWDKTIQIKGIEASTVVLVIAVIVLIIGVIQSFVHDVKTAQAETNHSMGELVAEDEAKRERASRFTGLAASPIAGVSALVVLITCASMGKGFVDQYPAYSVGLGNLRSLTGNTCGLASDAMLETNSNDSFLTPVNSTLGESLESEDIRGFSASGIPPSISQDQANLSQVGAIANTDDSTETGGSDESSGQSTGNTGGVRGSEGINGSNARLPFNLDYTQVPVVGSWTAGTQNPAHITTDWYEIPEATEEAPIIVVSAAGRIEHYDINGVHQSGQSVMLEYGRLGDDGEVEELGEAMMYDIGPEPSWRNLRYPLDQLPEDANVVRIVASDVNLDEDQWVALTPPRVPNLDSLNNVIGSETPGLLDWAVGLQFPCQRTFDHYAGVTEIPEYRISPDHGGKSTLSPFQDWAGGGAMGTAEAVNNAYEIPSYLRNDWGRDWGSIERYSLRTNSNGDAPKVADINLETIQRSGLWNPGHMKVDE